MTRPTVTTPPVRDLRRRRQDLLLASHLARNVAVGAIDELAVRADRVAAQVARVRGWLASPGLQQAGGVAGIVVLGLVWRRVRTLRLLRWGLVAWRLWRLAAPARRS